MLVRMRIVSVSVNTEVGVQCCEEGCVDCMVAGVGHITSHMVSPDQHLAGSITPFVSPPVPATHHRHHQGEDAG